MFGFEAGPELLRVMAGILHELVGLLTAVGTLAGLDALMVSAFSMFDEDGGSFAAAQAPPVGFEALAVGIEVLGEVLARGGCRGRNVRWGGNLFELAFGGDSIEEVSE